MTGQRVTHYPVAADGEWLTAAGAHQGTRADCETCHPAPEPDREETLHVIGLLEQDGDWEGAAAMAETLAPEFDPTERQAEDFDPELFGILSLHTIWTPLGGERKCITCGPTGEGGQAHLTRHVRAVLATKAAPLPATDLGAIKAEALREAADDFQINTWADVVLPAFKTTGLKPLAVTQAFIDWLRDRAALLDQPAEGSEG